MAHSLSAQKRIRQNDKRQSLNKWRKISFRTAIREYRESILHGTADEAQTLLNGLYKLLDKVCAKGAIHKKTASRYKSRLSLHLNKKRAAAA